MMALEADFGSIRLEVADIQSIVHGMLSASDA